MTQVGQVIMKHYKIFLSSTFEDLVQERQVALEAIWTMQWLPVSMEFLPAVDIDPHVFIERQIRECDFYLIILGGRYGSMDEKGVSFTEFELNCAIKYDVPVLAMVHSVPDRIPMGKTDLCSELRTKLDRLRVRLKAGRMVAHWSDVNTLRSAVLAALSVAPQNHNRPGLVREIVIARPEATQSHANSKAASQMVSKRISIRLDPQGLARGCGLFPAIRQQLKPGESKLYLVLPLEGRGREIEFVLPGTFKVSPEDISRLSVLPGVAEVLEM